MTYPPDRELQSPPRNPWKDRAVRERIAAAGMILAAVGLTCLAGWNNSATNDEPYFSLAAWSAVAEGTGDLCIEHPVLAWYLPGSALQMLNLEGTPQPPGHRLLGVSNQIRAFLYDNRAPPMVILRVARMAMLPFLILLLAGTYTWARDVCGPAAGLWGLGFIASQPLILGHAFVVHTDIPAAAGWVWTGCWLHRWVRGRPHAWLGTGFWLGFTLMAKFSGVQLALFVSLAALLISLRPGRRKEVLRLFGTAAVAGAVFVAGTWPAVRNATPEGISQLTELHGTRWPGSGSRLEAVRRLARFSVPAAHWALGLVYVAETSRHGQGVNYFFGRTSSEGFLLYFPAALALKVTAPFLAAILWTVVWAVRRRPPSLVLPLSLAAGYFVVTLGTSYNIGARHLMPALPLLAVAAGCAAVRWRPFFRIAAATALAAGLALAFPHFIAHFSLLAGGSRHGSRYLHDSNLDWGQDWFRLARRARQEQWHPLNYLYLGPAHPGTHLPDAWNLLEAGVLPPKGFVAASRWAETLGPAYLAAQGLHMEAAGLDRLVSNLHRHSRPIGHVGHSINVYLLAFPNPDPGLDPPPAHPPAGGSGSDSSGNGTPVHPEPPVRDPPPALHH